MPRSLGDYILGPYRNDSHPSRRPPVLGPGNRSFWLAALRPLETMLKVTLPDGKVLEYRHVRPIDIADDIGPRLAKATLAAEVDVAWSE